MTESEGEKPTSRTLFEKLKQTVAQTDDVVNNSREDLHRAQTSLTKTKSWLRLHRKETPVWDSSEKPTDKT